MSTRKFRRPTATATWSLRVLGALSLFGVAADHLYEYWRDHYSAIPTIGALFLLNGAGAIVLGLALVVPLGGLLRRHHEQRLRSVAAIGGIVLSAATLGGLLVAESRPLFGFMEAGYRPVVVLSIVAESTAILALGTFLALTHLASGTVSNATTTPRSGSVTMPRSRSESSPKGVSMKRLLIAFPLAAAIAAVVAGASGAFSSAHGGHAATAASAPMQMSTTNTTSGAATGPLRVELHRHVVRVTIKNFAFVPARVEVSPGTRVVWTNEDSDPHTVTTDRPGFSSQALDTGQRYAHVLSTTGTFAYHCTIHPFMHGTVLVKG
jgi:plastocyanin